MNELAPSINKADGVFYTMMGGKAKADTALKTADSANKQNEMCIQNWPA